MTIETTKNGNEVTVSLVGRLDTVTAPQLETELGEILSGINKLIFDFSELEYLSSAGLNALIVAQKTLKKQGGGEMVIHHVNDTIREVFEITGFLDFLNVE